MVETAHFTLSVFYTTLKASVQHLEIHKLVQRKVVRQPTEPEPEPEPAIQARRYQSRSKPLSGGQTPYAPSVERMSKHGSAFPTTSCVTARPSGSYSCAKSAVLPTLSKLLKRYKLDLPSSRPVSESLLSQINRFSPPTSLFRSHSHNQGNENATFCGSIGNMSEALPKGQSQWPAPQHVHGNPSETCTAGNQVLRYF